MSEAPGAAMRPEMQPEKQPEMRPEMQPVMRPVIRLLATVVLPFGFAFYLSFLVRTVNAVLAPDLARDLALTASDLGLLTSLYFFTFAAFQLPLGLLLDRYGPKRIQCVLLPAAIGGALVFAVADGLSTLALGRALIGLGVSGCLMAALKANVLWWPAERLPLVNAVTGTFGALGALSATLPVELLSTALGWRGLFVGLAGLILLAAAAIAVFVPTAPTPERRTGDLGTQVRELGQIYFDPYFWRVGLTCALHSGTFLAYQALWLGPWLRGVVGLERVEAANALLLLNFGMLCGSLASGAIADRLRRYGVPPVATLAGAVGFGVATQLVFVIGREAVPVWLCFVYGFFGAGGFIVYAVLSQRYPPRLAGRVNTAQNMMAFVVAFSFQWAGGAIIALWPETADGVFSVVGQQVAWLVFIALQAASLTVFLVTAVRGRRRTTEEGRTDERA